MPRNAGGSSSTEGRSLMTATLMAQGAPKAWDRWRASTGVPIHEGFFIPDLRTLELGWWEERQCQAAFVKLAGQERVCETRVTEIPPGATLPHVKVRTRRGGLRSRGSRPYVDMGRGRWASRQLRVAEAQPFHAAAPSLPSAEQYPG